MFPGDMGVKRKPPTPEIFLMDIKNLVKISVKMTTELHYSFDSSGVSTTAVSEVTTWPSLLSTDGLPEMAVRI